jgi:hypothetical protein
MNTNTHSSFPYDLHAESLARRDWASALMACPEKRRLVRLRELATTPPFCDQMADADYWRTVRHLLICLSDFERPKLALHRLLLETRPAATRPSLMDSGERERLALLPEEVVVFQGRDAAASAAWLWSLSARQAVWNAIRYADGNPVVVEARVKRSQILMLSNDLPTGSVLTSPDDVREKRTHKDSGKWISAEPLRS